MPEPGHTPVTEAKRILLIRLSSMGDIIHNSTAAAVVRENIPDAHIGWLVGDIFQEVLCLNPYVDQILTFPKKRWRRLWQWKLRALPGIVRGQAQAIRRMRAEGYEASVDLQGLIVGALAVRLARIPYRCGFSDAREGSALLLNLRVKRMDPMLGARGRVLGLLHWLGFAVSRGDMIVRVRPEWRQAAARLLEQEGLNPESPFVVVCPGAYDPVREWLPERFAAVADRLSEQFGLGMVLVGGAHDREDVQAVAEAMRTPAVALVGRTSVPELAAVLSMARLCLAGDTGSLYLALAAGSPSVGIFGPIDPRLRLMAEDPCRVVYKAVECAPCHRRLTCPHMTCMTRVSVEEVYEAARAALEGESNSR